jgi:hypothetical protein
MQNRALKMPNKKSLPQWLAVLLVACMVEAAAESVDKPANEAPGVFEHHGNAAHAGMFVVPSLTFERARTLHRDPSFHAEVAGAVYAQPLYWRVPGTSKALLLVATEQNVVYALDAATGATVWRTSLGLPVPHTALPCGNIDPLGITGTPVIDERTQALYLGAMIKGQDAPKHQLFAISLKDGAILSGWPIDVETVLKASGNSFNSKFQNQRGALTIVRDTLYIPYGGHFGDCGDYHGWVVGVSLQPSHTVHVWATRGRGGGIWAPGGLVSDGQSMYAVTGNTFGAHSWADGEAVIRLGLELSFSRQPQDFFAPADWQQLDDTDLDLGGTHALLLDLPGAKPSALVLSLGKDGKAYLLDRQNLGGFGASLITKKVSSGPIRTAPAAFSSGNEVRVAFQGQSTDCPNGTSGDLTVIAIAPGAPPALRVAWCATEHGRGSPIVTTTDGKANAIVWAVGAEGDNRLHSFRGETGEVVFSGGGASDAMGLVRHFQTLIAIGDHLYVAGEGEIYAFAF